MAQKRNRTATTAHQNSIREKTRLSDYAVSLLESKIKSGRILSSRTREKWGTILPHLIGSKTDGISELGDIYVDRLHRRDIEIWRNNWAHRVAAKDYKATTINGCLSVLRVITRAIKRNFELAIDPCDGVEDLPTKGHRTYTFEEPNSLEQFEVEAFLGAMRELYPQHFAMTVLGFATGLRPSSMRALRRSGSDADVKWDQNLILIRRSHGTRQEVMDMTKTGRGLSIKLPDEIMAILRWHVDKQLNLPVMERSNLLFPSEKGRFRYGSVLDKPFNRICLKLGLGKRITPRGMRRTFQDIARAANIGDVVARSISGHLTERMQQHYSTVIGTEQQTSLRKIASLVGLGGSTAPADGVISAPSGQQSGQHDMDSTRKPLDRFLN